MNMYKGLLFILDKLRKLVFPPKCIFCERMLGLNQGLRVCGLCNNDIEFCADGPCCEKCGKPIIGYGDKQLCYFCLNKNIKRFDRIISVFVYDGLVRNAIIKYKATGLRGHSDVFANCIETKILEEYSDISFDFIIGVPSHNRKNDVDRVGILCRKLSEDLNIQYMKNVFKTTRKVKKQSELGYSERFQNMRESLIVKCGEALQGKTVLLIDDVCTTRATIIECSRALKMAGVIKVYVATIATVKNPEC